MFYVYVDDKYVYDNANRWETNAHFRAVYVERYALAGHKVRFIDDIDDKDETHGPWNVKPYRKIADNENWGLRPRGEGYRLD
jgi:hypothetical protein